MRVYKTQHQYLFLDGLHVAQCGAIRAPDRDFPRHPSTPVLQRRTTQLSRGRGLTEL